MFSLEHIAKICDGSLITTQKNRSITGVSVDSRTVRPGDLFVALPGSHFDGHEFIQEAFRKGAVCALVTKAGSPGNQIVVRDPLKALQDLALFYRNLFYIPVVGITGSVGKTTTKECVGVVLSHVFKTRVGYGNWNNHLGVPLNLLQMKEEDQCLVLELGANHVGEIELLCRLSQPTVGVLTGVHPAHVGSFGSLERVYEAKLELADHLEGADGILFVNADDPELMRRLGDKKVSVVSFGTQRSNDYYFTDLIVNRDSISFKLNGSIQFKLRGYGAFNAVNALAALAVADYFNLDLLEISHCWSALPSIPGRYQRVDIPELNLMVINDAYNANPYSFKAGIQAFMLYAGSRKKIVVAGDMLDLGEDADKYHDELGTLLASERVDLVVAVGNWGQTIVRAFEENASPEHGGRAQAFEQVEAAAHFLITQLTGNEAIYVKGSHAVNLECLPELLRREMKGRAALI